jgi:hypothetical protein
VTAESDGSILTAYRKRATILIVALLVAVGLIFGGVRYYRNHIPLSPDEQQTQRAILERVPIGTSTTVAHETMERAGFHCEFFQNNSFVRRNAETGLQEEVRGKTFLWCDLERAEWLKLVDYRWQVIFLVPNGRVEGVEVAFGTIGL